MAQVTISINSREYPVACEDGQEARILQLANMLDEKAKMFTQSGMQVNENLLLAMVGLLLADELTEAKKSKAAQVSSGIPVVDKNRIVEIDAVLSSSLKDMVSEIKTIAKKIQSL